MANAIPIPRTVGDTLEPLVVTLYDTAKDPAILPGKTVTFHMKNPDGTIMVDGGACTIEPTQAFTVDPDEDRILCVGHGYKEGQQIQVTTDGSLPAGLVSATRYYVGDVTPNDFQLESRPGRPPTGFRVDRQEGDVVDITSTGSGTHSMWVVGQVQYEFTEEQVSQPGTYDAAFKAELGGKVTTYPSNDADVTLEIVLRARP